MANKTLTAVYDEMSTKGDKKILQESFGPDSPLHKRVLRQIEAEYDLCNDFMRPKQEEWALRLKIYNNQRRDKDKVGDNLAFSIHQTVQAALYQDSLAVTFDGRTEADQDQADNLTAIAKYDYDEMHKEVLDYDWIWDTGFFGKGYVLINDFDRSILTPRPEGMDPMTLLRDPRCVGLNGDAFGRSAARFWGRPIRITKYEMKDHGGYFNLGKLKKAGDELNSALRKNEQARREAQGYENVSLREENLDENYQYTVYQWFTHIDGKKYAVYLANDRSLVVRIVKLNWKEWPTVERQLFPISHDHDGVSIMDLVEDKQRARAVLLNLGIGVAKSDLYPMYLFDQNKIKNQNNLSFGFNKWIGVDGPPAGSVEVMQKKQISNSVDYIMNALREGAERASATPAVAQGIQPDKKRTLGENELIAQGSNARYSLPAKIFGWSEKRFWKLWYWVYEKNFKSEIDKKVARIVGAFGPKWTDFYRGDIIVGNPLGPDIEIESAQVSDAKKIRQYGLSERFLAIASKVAGVNMRYAVKSQGRLIMPKDQIDRIFPPTVDEIQAEKENESLNNNENVKVFAEQNHVEHLEVHSKAKETKAMLRHIEAHQEAMRLAKIRPDLFPGMPNQNANPAEMMEKIQPMNSQATPAPEFSIGKTNE